MRRGEKAKIIIDCDPGCDDALALMYAFGSEKFQVLAITTCCGNASREVTTKNAASILTLLGERMVPLYSGSKRPLRRPLETSVVHGEGGLGNLKVSPKVVAKRGASQRIGELARASPGEVTVVALAPLTNLARAYKSDPRGFRMLKELVVLGGTLNAAGNKGAVSEFNFFVDPEAAALVLESGIQITLVVLDACFPVSLTPRDFAQVKNKKLRGMLSKLLDPYMRANWREEGIRGAIMYDPLVVYAALHRKSVSAVPYRAVVETTGKHTRGMLVVDKRRRAKGHPNVRIITKIDRRKFERSFFAALNSLAL